ncbi:glycoside hydrolase superfamily [Chytriomyces sp. MP71]|nr:glycoside hydrolase superfamily [Chytriomyces sp. MP71]
MVCRSTALTIASLVSLAYAQGIPDIAWGFASSAYQIEGAWNVDGKGPSVWDTWFKGGNKLIPSNIEADPNSPIAAGDPFVTDDHYHRVDEDVAIMSNLKVSMYRFSVSWPRLLPNCSGQVNQAGIEFYSNLIDKLLANGIQPILTMYHWDTPQACQDQYGSLSNRTQFIADFTNYADVLFKNFGSRVKYWLTINEPAAYCGRAFGPKNSAFVWPPGIGGPIPAKYECVATVAITHGAVVNLARKNYSQYNMQFSMPLIIKWYIPVTDADTAAANQATLSQGDWLWGPLTTASGVYPDYLKTIVTDDMDGSLLPTFTAAESAIMKGTLDYVAVNYYSASYFNTVSSVPKPSLNHASSGVSWQYSYPQGIRDITKFLSNSYGPLLSTSKNNQAPILISECGYGSITEAFGTVADAKNDVDRQAFFDGITQNLALAVNTDKTPIFGFLAWSLMDNLEWLTFDQTWEGQCWQIGSLLCRKQKLYSARET